jgi:hypothetical protein
LGRVAPRRGSALALAVLLLLALELLAHGALLLAMQERQASLAGLRLLQARAAAEAAAARTLSDGLPDSLSGVPVLGSISLGGFSVGPHTGRTKVLRLGREVWLSEGEGVVAGGDWSWRAARLIWLLDPVARAVQRNSAIVTPPGTLVGGSGTVEAQRFLAATAPEWCEPWTTALDSLLRFAALSPFGTMDAAGEAPPRLGVLGPATLASLLPAGTGAAGTPAPRVQDGRCDAADPWNWGDTLDSGSPCAGTQVAAMYPGDLTLHGGRGQGLLVALGDLEMAGTVFHGLVLVGGDLRLRDGAMVRGQIQVGGAAYLAPDARVSLSPCDVARALEGARRWLRRPVPLPGVGLVDIS